MRSAALITIFCAKFAGRSREAPLTVVIDEVLDICVRQKRSARSAKLGVDSPGAMPRHRYRQHRAPSARHGRIPAGGSGTRGVRVFGAMRRIEPARSLVRREALELAAAGFRARCTSHHVASPADRRAGLTAWRSSRSRGLAGATGRARRLRAYRSPRTARRSGRSNGSREIPRAREWRRGAYARVLRPRMRAQGDPRRRSPRCRKSRRSCSLGDGVRGSGVAARAATKNRRQHATMAGAATVLNAVPTRAGSP